MLIEYKKLASTDLGQLVALIKLYEEVFEMENLEMPELSYLKTLLEKESTFFFVASNNEEVIGGLTAHILPSTYFASSEVYIYDFAIKTALQRKGIGTQLLAALKDYCRKQGFQEIFVQADLEDQHAIDFYKATGGAPQSVLHFSYTL